MHKSVFMHSSKFFFIKVKILLLVITPPITKLKFITLPLYYSPSFYKLELSHQVMRYPVR